MHVGVTVRIHRHDFDEAARDIAGVIFKRVEQDMPPAGFIKLSGLLAGQIGAQPRQRVEGGNGSSP
jgi:hypothetical protein